MDRGSTRSKISARLRELPLLASYWFGLVLLTWSWLLPGLPCRRNRLRRSLAFRSRMPRRLPASPFTAAPFVPVSPWWPGRGYGQARRLPGWAAVPGRNILPPHAAGGWSPGSPLLRSSRPADVRGISVRSASNASGWKRRRSFGPRGVMWRPVRLRSAAKSRSPKALQSRSFPKSWT